MSMYYVTNPDKAVAYIQSFINEKTQETQESEIQKTQESEITLQKMGSKRHSLDTREKIRDVLR